MTRMVRRAAGAGLLALALGAGAAEAAAQDRGPGAAAAGYVAAGVSAIGTGELDGRLAARGYPTFGRTAAAVGIGAHLLLEGGVMLGGEWQGSAEAAWGCGSGGRARRSGSTTCWRTRRSTRNRTARETRAASFR